MPRLIMFINCNFLYLVPRPTVTIIRDPEHPVELFTTNHLILTCVIELIPQVDSLVTINSQWSGHSSLTDSERRVIVSELQGVRLVHETSVTFSSLKTNDSGSYVCLANVSSQPSMSGQVVASSRSVQTINIAVGGCMASSTIQGIIFTVKWISVHASNYNSMVYGI